MALRDRQSVTMYSLTLFFFFLFLFSFSVFSFFPFHEKTTDASNEGERHNDELVPVQRGADAPLLYLLRPGKRTHSIVREHIL